MWKIDARFYICISALKRGIKTSIFYYTWIVKLNIIKVQNQDIAAMTIDITNIW